MTVEVEGVFAWVRVGETDLYDLLVCEDKAVGASAVDGDICGQVRRRSEGGVEGGYDRGDVGHIVEEGVVGAVPKVVHCHRQFENLVWFREEWSVVKGCQGHVVEGAEFVKKSGCGKRGGGIVEEIGGAIGVQSRWYGIEEILLRLSWTTGEKEIAMKRRGPTVSMLPIMA